MNLPKAHYCIGKYAYPGTGWYVMRNGHICSSGTKTECEAFVAKNDPSEGNELHRSLFLLILSECLAEEGL